VRLIDTITVRYYIIMPNISMHVDDTLELTYSVSDDTSELEKILNIAENSTLQNLNNIDVKDMKKFTWSPPSDGAGKTYTIDIESESEDLIVDVYSMPNSGISQEEDGNLSGYTGNSSYFSTTTSPTVNESEYAISFSNNQTEQYYEISYDSGKYNKFSMYLYPEDVNNEVVFADSSNGNAVFCLYFRTDSKGIYYCNPHKVLGTVSSQGSTGVRGNGVELVSGSSVSKRYYHIEFINIDWSAETLDISVDGTTVLTNQSFNLSGIPDVFQVNSNSGSGNPNTGGFVDKVDLGNN